MKYGLAIVIIAFLTIVGTVVLIGSTDSTSSSTQARNTNLVDYESKDTASVSWTQQGGLVGDDQRKAIRITITRNKRTVEILGNFAERVERSQESVNSPEAFSALVRALDKASFGQERNVPEADERGVCPTGNRFIYRLTDGGKEIMRTWSDNCSKTNGPFGGGNKSAPLIARLMKDQITEYSVFTKGVEL